jgi:hypothetical protein
MKKGKSCVIKGFKNLKSNYGTVDSKNLKSIYLNIQSWVEPKSIEVNWVRPVSLLNKKIKSTVTEILDNELFDSKFIVDMDLRTSGISIKKKSFMNLEITFFTKKEVNFKSIELKNHLKRLVEYIDFECFNKSNNFSFHLKKIENKVKVNN